MKHKHLPQFTTSHVSIARALRKNMTEAELKLWSLLRKNQLGVRFRRQTPLNGFVLDFYCAKAKLNVELDGSQRFTEKGKRTDRKRDLDLQQDGITVLRFSSSEMLQNPDGVLQTIMDAVESRMQST